MPSQLEQKGDLNLKANMGSDVRIPNLLYDLDMAWSPKTHWGIKTHLTTKLNEGEYDRIRYHDVAGVYYDSIGPRLKYELLLGFGAGNMKRSDFSSSRPNDHPMPPFIELGDSHDYHIDSRSSRFFVQPSWKFPLRGDKNVLITTGIRLQWVSFQQYYYEKKTRWKVDDPFHALVIDPFVTSSYSRGHFGVSTAFGYSFNLNDAPAPEYAHPVYKRFYYSVGVYLNLKKRSRK